MTPFTLRNPTLKAESETEESVSLEDELTRQTANKRSKADAQQRARRTWAEFVAKERARNAHNTRVFLSRVGTADNIITWDVVVTAKRNRRGKETGQERIKGTPHPGWQIAAKRGGYDDTSRRDVLYLLSTGEYLTHANAAIPLEDYSWHGTQAFCWYASDGQLISCNCTGRHPEDFCAHGRTFDRDSGYWDAPADSLLRADYLEKALAHFLIEGGRYETDH